jgi:putative DNA methylase
MHPVKSPKKLIEVAIALDVINEAATGKNSISPKSDTSHLLWVQRPLVVARAIIFAQMVNDPGFQYGDDKEKIQEQRKRLLKILEDLVQFNDPAVLERARTEIYQSWREVCELNKDHPQATELFDPEKLPAFHDPFARGRILPLGAQQLGLESYASDSTPGTVLINKAIIEIPQRFLGRLPVGPVPKNEPRMLLPKKFLGAQGLAEDIHRYGIWMHEQAKSRIGDLYPEIEQKRPASPDYSG